MLVLSRCSPPEPSRCQKLAAGTVRVLMSVYADSMPAVAIVFCAPLGLPPWAGADVRSADHRLDWSYWPRGRLAV